LKIAHDAVFNALAQEKMPDWVFSCKGRGHVMNAFYHSRPNIYMLTMDVTKFYPSCTQKAVYQLFVDKNNYGLPGDIAWRLSKILTYNDHIPTGSSVSSLLAFWAYFNCFDEIHRFSRAHSNKMSLYVDDIGFSSKKEPSGWFIGNISEILHKYGLSCNLDKTKIYKPNEDKINTGVTITSDGLLKPTEKILQKIKEEEKISPDKRKPGRLQSLRGQAAYILSYSEKVTRTKNTLRSERA
jgi:hypothetical protein